jgi:DNA-binding response OmpR family regulator/two-component sensor histidine kinase
LTEKDFIAGELAGRLDDESWSRVAKMAEIGLSAAAIVHEVRQPLSALKMALQLMREAGTRGEEAGQCLDDALEQTLRLEKLVGQMRSVLRSKPEQRSEIDLGELADEVLLLLTSDLSRRGIQVSLDREPDLPRVQAEKQQLEQLLFNLVLNARDAVLEAGGARIAVTAARSETGGAHVVVADDGTGIDPGIAEQVFEPFFTTKGETKGTGLGLYIARRVAEQNEGTLRLLDDGELAALDRGALRTGFCLEFGPPAQRLTIPPPVRATKEANQVLLVAGDEGDLQTLKAIVRGEGFDVSTARDSDEAVASLEDSPFDLMIADRSMEGLTGTELARLAHAFNPLLPILFLVDEGAGEPDEAERSLGVQQLLSRPIDIERLRLVLKEHWRPRNPRPVEERRTEAGRRASRPASLYPDELPCAGVGVVLVESDRQLREELVRVLGDVGCAVESFGSAAEAEPRLRGSGCDVLVARADVLRENGGWLADNTPDGPAKSSVAIMDSGGVDMAIQAIQIGASGVLAPPFDRGKVAIEIKRTADGKSGERVSGL